MNDYKYAPSVYQAFSERATTKDKNYRGLVPESQLRQAIQNGGTRGDSFVQLVEFLVDRYSKTKKGQEKSIAGIREDVKRQLITDAKILGLI